MYILILYKHYKDCIKLLFIESSMPEKVCPVDNMDKTDLLELKTSVSGFSTRINGTRGEIVIYCIKIEVMKSLKAFVWL